MRNLLFLFHAVVTGVFATHASGPLLHHEMSDVEFQKHLTRQMEKLGSSTSSERRAAILGLTHLSMRALPALKSGLGSRDAAVRTESAKIYVSILKNLAVSDKAAALPLAEEAAQSKNETLSRQAKAIVSDLQCEIEAKRDFEKIGDSLCGDWVFVLKGVPEKTKHRLVRASLPGLPCSEAYLISPPFFSNVFGVCIDPKMPGKIHFLIQQGEKIEYERNRMGEAKTNFLTIGGDFEAPAEGTGFAKIPWELRR